MSKRPGEESLEDGESRKRVHLFSTASVASLAPGISRWTSADIPDDLPPLPPISAELGEEVFRHPGLDGPNYETLEWYGDSVLEMVSTELVFETFRHYLPAGRCSQVREQLVRNLTLADYYRQYGMQHKTQLPKHMGSMADLIHHKGRDKDVIKIQGDIFEAYVGAVVKSDAQHGSANVVAWLKALWSRTIKDQIKQAERQHEASLAIRKQPPTHEQSFTPAQTSDMTTRQKELNAKMRLSSAVVVRGIKLRYEDMPCKKKDKNLNLPLFAIGVYLDGWGETNKLLGIGTALGKKEAGEKAAAEALENRKLLKVYESKKRAWMEEARSSKPKEEANE
ncbi:related to Ribonuclease III [Fusarium torulosum]|uniref:Related to Ribonuclease III n=1 Tax=Fusarium torulosum TaxID=33205 RepID=A0AAE8MKM6_9HYPO|nr:related to Ribonuclease III [Fusarium torulosum]